MLSQEGDTFHRSGYVVRDARATRLPAPDEFDVRVTDLNDRGVVLGEAGDPATPSLVTWVRGRPRAVPGGTSRPPRGWGMPAGVHATPIDLDNRGDILFASVDLPGQGLHLRYADGTIAPILSPDPAFPFPQTGTFAWNEYLGDDGSVAFFVRPGLDRPTRSWLWRAGRSTEIGPVAAEHLGRRGRVIGTGAGLEGGPRFVWQRDRLTPLAGAPTDVDAHGVVVGAAPAGPNAQPTAWRDGVAQPLPALPGQVSGTARALDDRGRIAGEVTTAAGVTRSVLWDNGRIFDLGDAAVAWVVAPDGAVYGHTGGRSRSTAGASSGTEAGQA